MTTTRRGPAPARTGPRETAADALGQQNIGTTATTPHARTRKTVRSQVDRDRFTSVKLLHVEVGTRWTAWLYGGRIWALLEHAGVPKMWDPTMRLWTIPKARVDDVLAYAEHFEGRFCTVEEVDR